MPVTQAPRIIPIYGCITCPHKHDWSSGGVVCRAVEPERTIIPGYMTREPLKSQVPDWCPLPIALAIQFGEHKPC